MGEAPGESTLVAGGFPHHKSARSAIGADGLALGAAPELLQRIASFAFSRNGRPPVIHTGAGAPFR